MQCSTLCFEKPPAVGKYIRVKKYKLKIMRDLKFRAYNTIVKRMSENTTIKELYRLGDTVQWQHIHIMQYTGIKDKKGKEIYEGDIVFCEQWNPKTYKVCFIEGCFSLCFLENGDYSADIHYTEDFEIIGNIYENKELIPCE